MLWFTFSAVRTPWFCNRKSSKFNKMLSLTPFIKWTNYIIIFEMYFWVCFCLYSDPWCLRHCLFSCAYWMLDNSLCKEYPKLAHYWQSEELHYIAKLGENPCAKWNFTCKEKSLFAFSNSSPLNHVFRTFKLYTPVQRLTQKQNQDAPPVCLKLKAPAAFVRWEFQQSFSSHF